MVQLMEEQEPIHTRVPQPLPISQQNKARQQFLDNVDAGVFGETGRQQEGTMTVATQYSLDHYWAQQWNLDLENLPHSLHEYPDKVQKMFKSYNRRGHEKQMISVGSKQTLKRCWKILPEP